MNCYSPAKTANNTHFHKKGFESGSYGTRKWPIPERIKNSPTCNLDFNVRSARAVVASRALQGISLAFLFTFTLSTHLLSEDCTHS